MPQWALILVGIGIGVLISSEQSYSIARSAWKALKSLCPSVLCDDEGVELPFPDNMHPHSSLCIEWKKKLGNRILIRSRIGGIYHFSETDQKTWWGAIKFCRSLGMNMAIFESREEMDAVQDVNPSKGKSEFYYWVAASSLGSSKKIFTWNDETPVPKSMWTPGDPSEKNQACASLSSRHGKLIDHYCGENFPILCELLTSHVYCLIN